MGRSEESQQFGHEGTSEHKMVEEQVQKLIRLDSPISEEWTAELKVLQDLIEHHVGEEESTGFSCARDEFTGAPRSQSRRVPDPQSLIGYPRRLTREVDRSRTGRFGTSRSGLLLCAVRTE